MTLLDHSCLICTAGWLRQAKSQRCCAQSCGLHPWGAAPPRPLAPHLSPLPLPLRKLADCAQLLEVDDMVRLAVPDSKCVYTYIQELYRSLVQKGLVKTKKK